MAKFKIGDKVKVKEGLVSGRKYGSLFYYNSLKFEGYREIKVVDENDNTYVIGDKTWYSEEMLDSELTPKKLLKSGMVVEYKDGSHRMVVGNILSGIDGHTTLDRYNEDLTHERYSSMDIQKIYGIPTTPSLIEKMVKEPAGDVIWIRPENTPKQVELTLEEIAEKFNIPVESIRIKD